LATRLPWDEVKIHAEIFRGNGRWAGNVARPLADFRSAPAG